MTNFTPAFDPVGFFPDYFQQSKLISLKNALLYNYHYNLKITDRQVYHSIESVFNEVTLEQEQIDLAIDELNCLYNYMKQLDLSRVNDELKGYNFVSNLDNIEVTVSDLFSEIETVVNNYEVQSDFLKEIATQTYLLYQILIEKIPLTYEERSQILFNEIMKHSTIPFSITNDQQVVIQNIFAKIQIWLDQYSRCFEYWKSEFENIVKQYVEEARLVMLNAKALVDGRNQVKPDSIWTIEEFKNLFLNTFRVSCPLRQAYFTKNIHNPLIIKAKYGGRSILNWYGVIIIGLKENDTPLIDVVNNIGQDCINFYKNSGYIVNDSVYSYIEHLIKTELYGITEMLRDEDLIHKQKIIKQNIENLNNQLEEKNNSIQLLNNDIVEKTKQILALKHENKTNNEKITKLTTEKTTLTNKVEDIKGQLETANAQKDTLNNKLKELGNQKKSLENQKSALEESMSNLQSANETLRQQIATLKQTKTTTIQNISTINTSITEKENEIADLKKQIEKLKEDKEKLEKLNKDLTAKLESIKDDNTNNVLSYIKKQLEVFKDIFNYEYDNKHSIKTNIKNIKAVTEGIIKQKEKEIEDKNTTLREYEEQITKLKEDKETAEQKLAQIEFQIQTNENTLRDKENIYQKYDTIVNEINQNIKTISDEQALNYKQKAELDQEINNLNYLKEETEKLIQINNEQIQKIEQLKEENEKKIKKIEEEKQELEKKKKLLEDEKNSIEKEKIKLQQKEQVLIDIEKDLNQRDKIIGTLVKEVIPKGSDPIETILIKILYDMGPYPDMSIKAFRETFIKNIIGNNIKIKIPEIIDNDNSVSLHTKTIIQWYEMYKQRLRNLTAKDFNPEGIMFSEAREVEKQTTASYLEKLINSNDLYDLKYFKTLIIQNGIVNENQKAYFLKRINNVRIFDAIIGDRTIDEWYNTYLYYFFKDD